MANEIRIDKTARTIIECRLQIDIEAVKKRYGVRMTKNGLTIPLENIKIYKTENGEEFVWLPFKGDGITAEISIPLNRLTNNQNANTMDEKTKITLDAIISSKNNDVENALKDFVTDNNIMYSAILVSRKKSYFAGDFVMNVINLARAIKKSPVARKCVEEALLAANGNYDYLQKRFKKGQDIEGIINME